MKRLDYCPPLLGYIVYPSAKKILDDQRVRLIQDINTIQMALGKPSLNTEQFDFFWDSPLEYLIRTVNDNALLLPNTSNFSLH